jgi:cell fate (sporulation/competence/biofilm development) regulator YlbF (YheA/YmcA/DUF963 family)
MQTILSLQIQEATDALVNNFMASEAFIRYKHAHARLDQDPQALDLLKQLTQEQAELRKKQVDARLTKEEIDSLRNLQAQVQENETIKAYAQAQQEADNFLREINGEISQMLGVDFASLAKHTGCC